MKKLTVKEALEQGYKSVTPRYEEWQYIDIRECDFSHKHGYEIVAKETKPYQLAYGVIDDLLSDYFDNQEDVENEDGRLQRIVSKVDFTKITDDVNNALSITRYFFGTDIQLIPNP